MNDHCPACSSSDSYLLADGRRLCRHCRVKFTPHPRQGRLPQEKREFVAQLFWNLGSAYQAADLAGINRKTAQRIYRELREKMAAQNDLVHCPPVASQGNEGRPEKIVDLLCGIGVREGTVWVAFPDGSAAALPPACCSYLVLGGQWGMKENFLSRILQRHLPHSTESDRGVASEFWEFSRKHLRRYRGSFRNEFQLYLKEMVFRFNNPDKDKALEVLLRS